MAKKKEVNGFADGARILCPFCSAPWTEAMIKIYDIDARHGEGSYDMGPEDQQATIDITCENCDRLIYRKEYRES